MTPAQPPSDPLRDETDQSLTTPRVPGSASDLDEARRGLLFGRGLLLLWLTGLLILVITVAAYVVTEL